MNFENIYRCPLCHTNLLHKEKQYVCSKGHCFDIAHNNYVNLLIDNQKKSKDPGDSKEMMESRRNFLNRHYYYKFSQKLNEVVNNNLSAEAKYVIDAGCGEGYFLSELKESMNLIDNHENIEYYGIDISKAAIKSASKRDKDINFVVGSNFNMPILSSSADCIIRNFAPGDNDEFERVLNKDGRLIIATPGVEHLYELKEILYKTARKHEVKDTEIKGFELIEHYEIKYRIELDNNEDIKNLISMTPYYWSITSEMRNNITEINELRTNIHVNFDVYKKCDL